MRTVATITAAVCFTLFWPVCLCYRCSSAALGRRLPAPPRGAGRHYTASGVPSEQRAGSHRSACRVVEGRTSRTRRMGRRTRIRLVHCTPAGWQWLNFVPYLWPKLAYNRKAIITTVANISKSFTHNMAENAQTLLLRFVVDLLYHAPTLQQWLSTSWNAQQMYDRTSLLQRLQEVVQLIHNKSS